MANKKINQLVLKTTIQSTDLFPLGDPTTGQLFKKTVAELQAAIGGAVISVNGLVGTVVLDTDDIQELATPTNRYFTEARARAAISLTTTGNSGASTYSNSTGVLNVPTYTLAGLGGITASFLSGGTGITYNSGTGVISYSGTVYTDASIRALVSAGTGLSYNSSTGVFSYSGTVYTDSSIRALLSGTAPITYNSSTGAIGITQATTSTDGYLSSTDWNTFNGKQSALTLGNLTEATSSVLTITGGTGAVIGSGTSIQVKQASSTVSGFLSSTDWNTFNGKQNVITNPVTGTGTSGHVAYFNGSGSIAGSANHFWDNTNGRLGIGTASPSVLLHTYSGTAGSEVARFEGAYASAGSVVLARFSRNGNAVSNVIRYTDTKGLIEYGSTTGHDIGFITSDTERMRITSAGNVGIGTSSPTDKLEVQDGNLATYHSVNAATAGYGINFYTNGGGSKNTIAGIYPSQVGTARSGDLIFSTSNSGSPTERMKIQSNGTAVFTTSASQHADFNSTDANGGYATFKRNGTSYGYIGNAYHIAVGGLNTDLGIAGLTNITFSSGNNLTIRGQVTAGGNWLLGTTTDNGERLYVSGSIRATGSITANSDARLKKNIERIENALEKVGQISGYTYNTIYDEDRHAGVIAQEIDKVLPEIVNKGNDGLMGVEYGNISALLIEAIKDLKKDNESLRAIVEGLRK